ncbi:hypothetical protein F4808DRAFT_471817 [Astrocystis sublimbata]|nr:hypothetical protein F4808DRAFT_471817 [Astrocystis sublimbata]
MFPKRGQIVGPRSSLNSLRVEQQLGDENTNRHFSQSNITASLVDKHHFQFYHQAVADVRQSGTSLKLWFLFTVFAATVMTVVKGFSSFRGDPGICSVGGSFKYDRSFTDVYSTSDFFQINIATGNLTFTQAKVVDTTWGLVVGRGGQATLSLVTWRVFANFVTKSMTIQPVTFATFRIVFAESGPSVFTTARLLHDFIRYKSLPSRLASVFLIYSILLPLALPTLISSASGYATLNETFIREYNNNLVPFASFNQTNSDREKMTWDYSNRTYQVEDIRQRGVCIPVKDRYQWGASFLQTLLLFLFVAFWAIGCLVVSLLNNAHHRLEKDNEPPQGYQALGILVASIDEQLINTDAKVSTTTDRQLKRAIEAELNGGSMSFEGLGRNETFRQWLAMLCGGNTTIFVLLTGL